LLIYINDLTSSLPPNPIVHISLYADDTAVLNTARSRAECEATLQPQLDSIAFSCHRWKVELSNFKCSYTNFTLDPKENGGKKTSHLTIQDLEPPAPPTTLKMEQHPVFLGLTFDDQLTFRPHAVKIKGRMKAKRSALTLLLGRIPSAPQHQLCERHILRPQGLLQTTPARHMDDNN
jgi:hypothetical protein